MSKMSCQHVARKRRKKVQGTGKNEILPQKNEIQESALKLPQILPLVGYDQGTAAVQ